MERDIEQYRPGFEAWARGKAYPLERVAVIVSAPRDYEFDHVEALWKGWVAAKLEACTEPSELVESLRAALRSVNATAIERGDKYGVCDQIDNSGNPYQSQWLADLLAGNTVGAAIKAQAKAQDKE